MKSKEFHFVHFQIFLTSLVALLLVQTAPSQASPDPARDLSTYMQEVRVKKPSEMTDVKIAEAYGATLIPELAQYARDPDPGVAHCAFRILAITGRRAESVSDRHKAVESLVTLLDDARIIESLGRALMAFRAGDFSEISRKMLSERLRTKAPHLATTALVVGVAGMTSEIPQLAEFLSSHPQPGGFPAYWQSGLAWAALRARARLGVQEDIQKCIDIVEASSDKETRANRLFLSLAYVRQPKVAKYLIGYLNDDTVVQHPASLDGSDPGQRTQIAGRAAEALATMLEGFPKKYPRSHISQENLTECRQWVAAQKELKLIR